jgi:hypothetical protein
MAEQGQEKKRLRLRVRGVSSRMVGHPPNAPDFKTSAFRTAVLLKRFRNFGNPERNFPKAGLLCQEINLPFFNNEVDPPAEVGDLASCSRLRRFR